MSDVKVNHTEKAGNRGEHKKNEENKQDKGVYKHKQRNPYYKERVEVTLETVVPDLPKKSEMHPKPDDEAYQVQIDKIQKDIDDIFKKISDIAKEARNKSYLPADKTFEDLISLLKVKQEGRKKASDEFQAVVTERDLYKKQVDEYLDKGNELRFKMKIPGKRSDLEREIRELKSTQSKGSISMQEEKRLIKEIADLEKSLPYAGPLEDLEEQSKEVKDMLKIAKQNTAKKFETLKLLRDECKDIQDKIDKMREEHEKKKEETTPAIDKMKEEYRSKINNLKQKKKDLYEKQNEAWRKFEDQQVEVERIKFIKRKKEKLVREEQRKKRDEEWKKQKQAEVEENKDIPYRVQIELCDLLIGYCNKLSPSTESSTPEVTQKDKNVVIQEALASDEWKQAKGQYLTGKKEKEDSFFAGKGGKKKVQKKVNNKKDDEYALPLNHQIETLNYFEEIKVSPPLFTDMLEDALKVLKEKKAYFDKLSKETMEADENRKNLSEEERKKLEEEEKAKKQTEQTEKKDRRTTAKPRFDIESEQDFPKM